MQGNGHLRIQCVKIFLWPLPYLLWKLNFMIAKLNMNAKATVKTTCTTATTHKRSWWKPKCSVTNWATVWSLRSILVWISPNWEATKPYSVHANGQTQQNHLHQTGIFWRNVECAWVTRKSYYAVRFWKAKATNGYSYSCIPRESNLQFEGWDILRRGSRHCRLQLKRQLLRSRLVSILLPSFRGMWNTEVWSTWRTSTKITWQHSTRIPSSDRLALYTSQSGLGCMEIQ